MGDFLKLYSQPSTLYEFEFLGIKNTQFVVKASEFLRPHLKRKKNKVKISALTSISSYVAMYNVDDPNLVDFKIGRASCRERV